MAGKTLVEKIIAAHLLRGELTSGAEVEIRIDQTLCQDATGTMAFLELEAMGVERVRTELSVQYVDHNTTQFGPENRNDHLYLQSVCAAKGVLFSRPGNGICHQIHLERFGVPGQTLLGADSHTPTNGGLGMLAIGAGGLDVAAAMAGAGFRMAVPRVMGVRLVGELAPWVAAKDIILHVLSILGTKGNVGVALEYSGPGVGTLSVPERATIANMGAELGVTSSVFPSDAATLAFLRAQDREPAWTELCADDDASYDRTIEVDLSQLEPLAACPSSPGNVRPVAALGEPAVGQVIVGSCTNSSLKDMSLVASVLAGRKVHPALTLAVAPGSRQVLEMIARNGALADMLSAGARILESACGPCIGQGASPSGDSVTVRTFNRNFSGRSGTKNDKCFLVSPETAAAAAVTGRLTDPRSLSMEYPKWEMPARFLVDDSMILRPPADGAQVEIVRKETIGAPPQCTPLPADIDGEVLIRVGDKITTDHIMPAGAFLKLRSNIGLYARVVFDCFNAEGQPTFAEKAAAVRDSGRCGVIAAGESYGQGSSREHAAICPMHLGVRVVAALGFERIHAANLVNFGILPLIFLHRDDYERSGEGDSLRIADVREQLRPGRTVDALVSRSDGSESTCKFRHDLSEADIATVLAGGRLSLVG